MQTPKNLPYHTIINAPPFTFFIIVFPLSIVYNLSCIENYTWAIIKQALSDLSAYAENPYTVMQSKG